VGLEPGAEEKLFVAGDTIKQTQSAVVLESLISQFLFSKAADAGSTAPAAAAAPAVSGAKK
jgi:phospholipid/cholesterol/gamma-HCH transport system substrate-binding protein